jgi:hypothetical protein
VQVAARFCPGCHTDAQHRQHGRQPPRQHRLAGDRVRGPSPGTTRLPAFATRKLVPHGRLFTPRRDARQFLSGQAFRGGSRCSGRAKAPRRKLVRRVMAEIHSPCHPPPTDRPQMGLDHPLPEPLAADLNADTLRELLGGQRRTEIGVVSPHQRHHPTTRRLGYPAVRRPPTRPMHQPGVALSLVPPEQPTHLTHAQPQQPTRLDLLQPAFGQRRHHLQPILLFAAHTQFVHACPLPKQYPGNRAILLCTDRTLSLCCDTGLFLLEPGRTPTYNVLWVICPAYLPTVSGRSGRHTQEQGTAQSGCGG